MAKSKKRREAPKPTQLVLSGHEMMALIELIEKRISDSRFAKNYPENDNLSDHRLSKDDFKHLADRLQKLSAAALTIHSPFIVLPLAQTRKEHYDERARELQHAEESAKWDAERQFESAKWEWERKVEDLRAKLAALRAAAASE